MSTVAESVDHRTETKVQESSANPYKEACSFNQIPHQKIQTSLHNNHLNRSAKFLQKAKMSLIPSFFGTRRSNVFDPLSLDIWDPFEGCPFLTAVANLPSRPRNHRHRRRSRGLERDAGGPRKEEVKVEVEDGGILQISGERSWESKEEKNENGTAWKRRKGKLLRRFRLPENAKLGEVKTGMENGVLTVTVPKEEVKKPVLKAIDISA
ncbi:class I heat shock protein [Sesamum alatum]|uniref:Class I heat shock protein n=1 Tax=Sesamum alatum TaxID=300844 RepID=A0AAE1Y8M8_9LAMI|nr:class I heat shock protein [Sesamum alatum]